MQTLLPLGAFASPVPFAIEHLNPVALPSGEGVDPDGVILDIDPVAAYQFTFDVLTLAEDAALHFEVDVAGLDAQSQTDLLAALPGGVTLTVQSDGGGTILTFALCGSGEVPTAGGCAALTLLDDTRTPLPPGSMDTPAFVVLDAVVDHFSTYSVVITRVAAPQVAPAPHDRRKNRYVSFAPNNGSGSVAFRVAKTTAPTGSCWVQAPVQAGANQYAATCGANPVFRVWSEPVIHVGDCEVIPVANYDVAATADGAVFSSSLAVGTILLPTLNSKLWGDTVGINNGSEWTPPNGFTNVNDVLGILAYINGAAIRPQFTVANLQAISSADSCLNAFVNTADVQISVRAISGDSYGPPNTGKITDPAMCPGCP